MIIFLYHWYQHHLLKSIRGVVNLMTAQGNTTNTPGGSITEVTQVSIVVISTLNCRYYTTGVNTIYTNLLRDGEIDDSIRKNS